jgi:hypothetical protein
MAAASRISKRVIFGIAVEQGYRDRQFAAHSGFARPADTPWVDLAKQRLDTGSTSCQNGARTSPKEAFKVERLIATKQPKNYARALELLVDLRDLAAREGGSDFRLRLDALRAAHARKLMLLDRLKRAGL